MKKKQSTINLAMKMDSNNFTGKGAIEKSFNSAINPLYLEKNIIKVMQLYYTTKLNILFRGFKITSHK